MLRQIELKGSAYEMGRQHGEQLKDSVRQLARIRLALAQRFATEHGVEVTEEECREVARRQLPLHEQYSRASFDEWRGIADGAEMPIEDVFFANALTDFQDLLWQRVPSEVHGCTSFAVGPEATADGATYIGQTWDMHASAEDFIAVFHRLPEEGPESLTMTTAGCLTLVGVNAAGVAVCNNNLRPRDARDGVIYLAMLHEALQQTDWESALAAITDAPRCSGHNYIVGHESGARANIETTAAKCDVDRVDLPRYVHTNHYLAESLIPWEDPTNESGSSKHRLERLRTRFAENDAPLTPTALRGLLSDHDGGQSLCICRHGTGEDARSCAFVVADPRGRRLVAALGPPCHDSEFQEFSLPG